MKNSDKKKLMKMKDMFDAKSRQYILEEREGLFTISKKDGIWGMTVSDKYQENSFLLPVVLDDAEHAIKYLLGLDFDFTFRMLDHEFVTIDDIITGEEDLVLSCIPMSELDNARADREIKGMIH